MKIVVLDAFTVNPGDLSWQPLRELGEVICFDRTVPEKVVGRIADADAVLTNKVVITGAMMDECPKLKYIGILATGNNVVGAEDCAARGITLRAVPKYGSDSVAQHAFALLLAATNRVEHYARLVSGGVWSRCEDFTYRDTPMTELAGLTMGILGLGNIGSRVARMADAFGMRVVATTTKEPAITPAYIERLPLEEMLAESDVVSLHCPLCEQTRQIINRERLALMRPGAILINTGRGPLIDEYAVAEALRTDKLGAYCADVLSQEPPEDGSPLIGVPHCFLTPHIAWATKAARQRLLDMSTELLSQFTHQRPFER